VYSFCIVLFSCNILSVFNEYYPLVLVSCKCFSNHLIYILKYTSRVQAFLSTLLLPPQLYPEIYVLACNALNSLLTDIFVLFLLLATINPSTNWLLAEKYLCIYVWYVYLYVVYIWKQDKNTAENLSYVVAQLVTLRPLRLPYHSNSPFFRLTICKIT